MKIVLDTNCLVNLIMPGSFNNDVWQAFRANKYVLFETITSLLIVLLRQAQLILSAMIIILRNFRITTSLRWMFAHFLSFSKL